MGKTKIGFVVDNPERDLEGLVLASCELAKMGFEVILIPMYKQRFVVRSQKIDIVVMNYLRTNNLETFLYYKRAGVKVAILETEGDAGAGPQRYSDFFFKTGITNLIDLCMFWGREQMNSVITEENLRPKMSVVTGCPRYDFCAESWAGSLVGESQRSDYILVNTNFPMVNPKFSSSSSEEFAVMKKVGFSGDFISDLIDQNVIAFAGMKGLLETLSKTMPEQHFIIRPHPFENINGYADLAKSSNVEVIQEGSANFWIYRCRCMIQLNCTTAIEAALMKKPIISPEWLNGSAIFRSLPQSLSQLFNSVEEMEAVLKDDHLLNSYLASSSFDETNKIIEDGYHYIDGKAYKRVALAISSLVSRPDSTGYEGKSSCKRLMKQLALDIFEKPILWNLRERIQKMNKDKYFTSSDVAVIMGRLQRVKPEYRTLASSNLTRLKNSKGIFSDVTAVIIHD